LQEYAKRKAAHLNKLLRDGQNSGISEQDLEDELENYSRPLVGSFNGSQNNDLNNTESFDNNQENNDPEIPNSFNNQTNHDNTEVPTFTPLPRNPYPSFPKVPSFDMDNNMDKDEEEENGKNTYMQPRNNFQENTQNTKQPNFGQPPPYQPLNKNTQNTQQPKNTQNTQQPKNTQNINNQQQNTQNFNNQYLQNSNNQYPQNTDNQQSRNQNSNTQQPRNTQNFNNQYPQNTDDQQSRNQQQRNTRNINQSTQPSLNNQQSRNIQQQKQTEYIPQQSYGSYTPTLNNLNDSQKYAKYALSSLQFEDVPTAVENLYICLKLLTGVDLNNM